MSTFSQVVKEESFEIFEKDNVFSSQKTDSIPLTDETSISTSVTNETTSSSAIKSESSTTKVVKSVTSEKQEKIRSFRELCGVLDVELNTKSSTNAPVPPAKPPLSPDATQELASTPLVQSVKAKIRTIEELLDSSSDLDLPTTPPPPKPISVPSVSPPPTPVSLPISVSEPIDTVSKQAPVLTTIPESSKRPTASKRVLLKQKMSASRDIFYQNNGTSDDHSASKMSNDNKVNNKLAPTSLAGDEVEDRADSVSPTPTTTSIGLSGNVSINHYERLIEELKCPGCASPMKAPIKLCATGHSICHKCTTVLALCPLCKDNFIDLRSLTLEAVCSKAHFRCSNAAHGCTVRLQPDLLTWHEKQCIWKSMKCFMGRVWGDCVWTGREAGWKDHLETAHADRVFTNSEVNLVWNMNGILQSLSGYYVFEVYDEMFNFYQIYDRDRILFTMTVTSTIRDRKLNFAYEVELFHQDNEALVITQRFPVHSEYDKDILLDGTCVSVSLTDLSRLIGSDKILNFRVRIQEIKSPRRSKAPKKPSRKHAMDFQKTDIEGANLKSVPSGVIVTRKPDDLTLELVKDNDEEQDFMKDEESSSSDDPEFEAFIEKKWGTPQMNFNRKYLRSSLSKDSNSSSASSNMSGLTDGTGAVNGSHRQSCEIGGTKSKMRNVTSSLRKSFRSLRTEIIDLKKPFVNKKSPEKKESLIKK